MTTKETPINYRTYYKLMKERTSKRLEECIKEKDKLELELNKQHDELKNHLDVYKEKFEIDLFNHKEFVVNEYLTGSLYKYSKVLLTNRKNDYELISELYDIFNYAETQKKIYDLKKDIEKCKKLLSLNIKEYNYILKTYYTEVHKKLILEGNGYAFGNNIGWICVNRCLTSKRSKAKLDFAATKKREAELKAQGKRIYNKEEADWCARNGIEYKAEDKRVFKKDEYYYEIPLISCKLKNGWKLKLEIADYRHNDLRGITNEQLIEKCNNDINKICELPIDLKSKVTICDKVDKILYTKFIRNETQKSITSTKVNSKDR